MSSIPPLYFMYANRYRTSSDGMGWVEEGAVEAGIEVEEADWEVGAELPALAEAEEDEEEVAVGLEGEAAGADACRNAGPWDAFFAGVELELTSFLEEALGDEACPQPASMAKRAREAVMEPAIFRVFPVFIFPSLREV